MNFVPLLVAVTGTERRSTSEHGWFGPHSIVLPSTADTWLPTPARNVVLSTRFGGAPGTAL